MNYFVSQTAAARYALNRPYFHPLVIRKIRSFLLLEVPIKLALDVACGTGQSAIALKEIAEQVIAIDASAEMLAQAPANPKVQYLRSSAEDLPFADHTFDLITVSSAFHWLNRSRFLAEAHRVLRSGAWLIIYNNHFSGRMKENLAFEPWHKEHYLVRYPIPPRHHQPFTDTDALEHGFRFVHREEYSNEIGFMIEQLVGYSTT